MGTSTSKQEVTESKEVKNDEIGDAPPVEQNEYKGDEHDRKEPVIEEEIVPTDSIQVRSFLAAPGVSLKV